MPIKIFQKMVDTVRGKYKPEFLKRYDEVVSLGYNCEISQRLFIDLDYKFSHYLFTWVYVHDRNKFLNCLDHLDKIYEGPWKLNQYGMFTAENYKVSFHSRTTKDELFTTEGKPNEKAAESAISELKSRVKYLAEKTELIFNSNKKVLFIIKIQNVNMDSDINFIKELYAILKRKYKTGKFTLLCVLESNHYNSVMLEKIKKMQTKQLKIRTIKRFADDSKTDCDGDIEGWINLLKKFLYFF